jgi:hypothetical protein
MRESLIEKYMVARVKALGGLTRKVRWLCRKGAPDRFISFPGGVAAWVELKREGRDEADPLQVLEIRRLREHGHLVYLINSRDAVDRMLNEILGG